MNPRFWVVWNEQGRAPAYKHQSEAGARNEAERLTKAHGGKFHVLGLVATCEKNDVTWNPAGRPLIGAPHGGSSPELSDLTNHPDFDDSDPY